ncbi:argininosuccinate lyase [Anseongella ginsenosidimutans]|uniref:Argininosuccinate lyase n=1 Tax=Anseongella ginsenosidimutans TaxID=496056 RepID=A0A4R3KYP2_9SPHI|nr:argininosuccinate lyase [Anseongella ginsenosidimutans]QEC51749.1 argininosuccinate lyase [Anseongella ginsenosidimutans]TCS89112.1 argininosuccinate lyase [Anseongella ginsenosidimutans]
MKLWQKNAQNTREVEKFTIGRDQELDLCFAVFDVWGSIAHVKMLHHIGLLEKDELELAEKGLKYIYSEVKNGNFHIKEGVEDVHSQVEMLLTGLIGDIGKKIHSGRSRNDQALLDLKLYFRHKTEDITGKVEQLFSTFTRLSEEHKDKLLPGYTHLQIAMPSSFGLWFGAYAESLVDDMELLLAAFRIANKNPLGSAAGYGSSFPLDRQMTTRLLGFETMNYNSVYAQMTRGKTEKAMATAIASIAATISKFSYDVCLYMNQNFGFISFPDELTTGSSIMPHKKNPDVFELLRGKCNRLQALPNEFTLLINNLPSGYHREMQLTKEVLFPAFTELETCITICDYMLQHIIVKDNLLKDPRYTYLFSVEAVNKEVLAGLPFRDAYRKVGMEIEADSFSAPGEISHTHEGSIGNLCNDQIRKEMNNIIHAFGFPKIHRALEELLQ